MGGPRTPRWSSSGAWSARRVQRSCCSLPPLLLQALLQPLLLCPLLPLLLPALLLLLPALLLCLLLPLLLVLLLPLQQRLQLQPRPLLWMLTSALARLGGSFCR